MRPPKLIYILAVVLPLLSCSDDDDFSTSPGNLLTMGVDTLRLDTVFSRVPSATRTFSVYNHTGSGLRCSRVYLENGNQTGFRVNVDGMYLSPSTGYTVQDVEIRKNDSIRVFVELTSPVNHGDTPQLVSDNLVFSLDNGQTQKVNLNAYSWDADLVGNMEITRDTTISSTKPIVVRGGIKVDSAATLTISGGTTLYFDATAGIDVYGTLISEGTAEKNNVLRGSRIDHMFGYLPYDRVPAQWMGIRFHSSSYNNLLNYTDIHSTNDGIVCDSSAVDQLKLRLYNSIVHNCQGYGLLSKNSVVDIWNSQLTNTLHDVVAIYGGAAMLRHCTVAQFYPFDSERGVALRFNNQWEGHTYPLYQFEVYNTIVTGYADDEIMGEAGDTTATFTYYFDHDLLRTEVSADSANTELYNGVMWENPKDTTVAGEKNFENIDADQQYYDFRLSDRSKAIDAGQVLPNGYSATDRLGTVRDDKPDLGAYERKEN